MSLKDKVIERVVEERVRVLTCDACGGESGTMDPDGFVTSQPDWYRLVTPEARRSALEGLNSHLHFCSGSCLSNWASNA